ncbi:hypothetical protein NDU88_006483 [Pleurodeles waltl]|uniref:Uncharacterized protein n=1 Tax=Pleurodeles waltl TaxID=8319 RepID=A0AAV7VP88_PLEWA|nr:hypothetical protein NDU88_006483 [Pleurodeles waltl]
MTETRSPEVQGDSATPETKIACHKGGAPGGAVESHAAAGFGPQSLKTWKGGLAAKTCGGLPLIGEDNQETREEPGTHQQPRGQGGEFGVRGWSSRHFLSPRRTSECEEWARGTRGEEKED